MPGAKRLIVGLGNPGAAYEETRHNVGFAVVDALAEKTGVSLVHGRGDALLGWGRWRSRAFGLAKPLTYMNRSGLTVRTLVRHYGLTTQEVLVVVDDINLPVGRLRLRPSGSAGGHNGVQDIIDRLGTTDLLRLRLGVGSNFRRGGQVDYVLSPFTTDEQGLIDEAIVQACEAALTFVTDGMVAAMNRYNRR